MSTQQGFGLILHELARSDGELAKRIVTTSPDVTVSTNLGAWVNRRGLFAKTKHDDLFKREKIPSTYAWEFSPSGQHIELGIAEMNLFLLLSALGLSHDINGERLLPIGTLYDPFIQRGLDALNYACYQDARFMVVATPSGITLAPEGGAHQSIATPLIGMGQPGLASFEPAFVDELAVMMQWGFEHMQRAGGYGADDEAGGSVYLRLSTRTLEQVPRSMTPQLAKSITDGAYWLREPGPNCQVVIAYTGAVAPEAIEAAGLLSEDRRDVGLLAVTSADRLFAQWSRSRALRRQSHASQLLTAVPPHCAIVTVNDGHPAALAWLGGVKGHCVCTLGVEAFGQSASLDDLYASFGIDVNGVIRAVEQATEGKPIRHRKGFASA
jgi:pyruvate dehydrogenase E1 component